MTRAVIGLFALAALAASGPAQAQQRAVDRNLIAAGFVMRSADTPGKMKALQALRPYTFASRTKNGVRYYIYPDPTDCRCAFVGYQQAFDTYRDMVAPPPPPPGTQEFKGDATRPGFNLENFTIDQMNEDAGLMDGDDIFHLNFN
jgi:hypothetical protein